MQAHCSHFIHKFSQSGLNWKWLEQLIRCFHGRALTTKSKQCSFGTIQTEKYWGRGHNIYIGCDFFFSPQYQNNGKKQVLWHISGQWEITEEGYAPNVFWNISTHCFTEAQVQLNKNAALVRRKSSKTFFHMQKLHAVVRRISRNCSRGRRAWRYKAQWIKNKLSCQNTHNTQIKITQFADFPLLQKKKKKKTLFFSILQFLACRSGST